jgi:hypothetical protein
VCHETDILNETLRTADVLEVRGEGAYAAGNRTNRERQAAGTAATGGQIGCDRDNPNSPQPISVGMAGQPSLTDRAAAGIMHKPHPKRGPVVVFLFRNAQ